MSSLRAFVLTSVFLSILPLFAYGQVTPSLSAVSATTVDEGSSTTLTGNITDPDIGDTFTLTVDWGDGSTAEVFNYGAGTTTFSETHQYDDDDPTGTTSDSVTINLVLEDSFGLTTFDSTAITVNNVAPSLTSLTIDATFLTVDLSGTIADPGSPDTFLLTVDWGDGSIEMFNYGAGTTAFTESHTYATAGAYTIDVTLEDDDGGVDNASTFATAVPVPVPALGPHGVALLTLLLAAAGLVAVRRSGF